MWPHFWSNPDFVAPQCIKNWEGLAMRTVQPCMIFIASMNGENLYKSADAYCIRYSSEVTCIFFHDFSRIIAQECSLSKNTFTCFFSLACLNCFTWKHQFIRWEPVALLALISTNNIYFSLTETATSSNRGTFHSILTLISTLNNCVSTSFPCFHIGTNYMGTMLPTLF